MNFLSMKYFCVVEKERSITKAAAKLYITQQTLSAHIAAIEKEIGCRLFIRHAPLELTYAGGVFFNYAQQFERLRASMETEFADIRQEEGGILKVGIAHTRGRAIMPDIISAYQAVSPKMQVQVIERTNDILLQNLKDRELDVLIANFPDNVPEINSCLFYEEEVVLLLAKSLLSGMYKEKAGQIAQQIETENSILPLAECPFLLSDQENIAGRIGRRMIAEAAFIPKVNARSSNVATLLELCARGRGACFCPELLAYKTLPPEAMESLAIIRFGNVARYQIRLGWYRQPYNWKAVSGFVDTALSFAESISKRFPK